MSQIAGAILSTIGTGMQLESDMQTIKAQSALYDYNRAIDYQNAEIAQEQGKADIADLRRNAYKTIGAQRAAYGASGVSSTSGSALDVLADSTMQAELDVQRRQYAADLQSKGYLDDAALLNWQKKINKQIGTLNAAASFFKSSGQTASQFMSIS